MSKKQNIFFKNNMKSYDVYLKKHPLSGLERNNQPTKIFQNDTFRATEYLGNLG